MAGWCPSIKLNQFINIVIQFEFNSFQKFMHFIWNYYATMYPHTVYGMEVIASMELGQKHNGKEII